MERGELRDEVDGEFRRVMEDELVFVFLKGFKLVDGGKGKEKCEKREESVRFMWVLV